MTRSLRSCASNWASLMFWPRISASYRPRENLPSSWNAGSAAISSRTWSSVAPIRLRAM